MAKEMLLFSLGVPSLTGLRDALTRQGATIRYGDKIGAIGSALAQNDCDQLILGVAPVGAGKQTSLADMTLADWMAIADEGQWSLLAALQQVHAALGGRSCSILILGPSIAQTGAAGHVAFATATEGQRGLMKALARQWGPRIRLNWLSIWAPLYFPEINADHLPQQPELGEYTPPLGDRPGWDRIANAVVAMTALSAGATGQSIIADGGEWMLP